MVDPVRLLKPQHELQDAFPALGFREEYSFRATGERVLLTDPTYLADVYNSQGEIASYVRQHGVIITDFGGDVYGPVWFQLPYLLLPISTHYDDNELEVPPGVALIAENVHCDSGSFVFLPMWKELPPALRGQIDTVLKEQNGALLDLPPGLWSVYYEQWDVPEGGIATFYRNIVALRE